MHKLIVLTIALTMVYCSVFSEEVQQEAEKSKVHLSFEALPYQPSDKQIEEFYTTLKAECRLSPPQTAFENKQILKQLLDFLGVEKLPFFYLNPTREKEMFPRKQDAIIALRRHYAYRLCLIRLAMEGDCADNNKPVSQLERCICAVFIEQFTLESSSGESRHDSNSEHRKWFKEKVDDINNIFKYREQYQVHLDTFKMNLKLNGLNKWEQLSDWCHKYDASKVSCFEAEGFLNWLYSNFHLNDILSCEQPELITLKGETFCSLLDKYVKKDFLNADDATWRPDKKKAINAADSFNARFAFTIFLMAPKVITGKIAQAQASFLLYAFTFEYGASEYLCGSARKGVCSFVKNKMQEFFYMQNYRIAAGANKLRKIDEGESGAAWFMGSTIINGNKGTINTKEDTIFPSLYFISRAQTGYTYLLNHFKDSGNANIIYNDTGCFKWHPFTHFEDEEPTPILSARINTSIEYDITLEGKMQLMIGEMGRTFLKGTSYSYDTYQAILKGDMLSAGVFHYYSRTRWELYSLWDYNSMFDYYFYERPICILVVRPHEDYYENSIVGLYSKDLSRTVLKCGAYYRTQRLWTAEIFEKEMVNAEIFDKAKQITLELDDVKGERWKKAHEDFQMYQEEHKYEVYW